MKLAMFVDGIKLLLIFKLFKSQEAQAFSACLIVNHAGGSEDPTPTLQSSVPFFTTGASDTEASLYSLLTGETVLTNNSILDIPTNNIFTMLPQNISTGYFGDWPFKNPPLSTRFFNASTYDANNNLILNNVEMTIQQATNFINANQNFFCIVKVPRHPIEYIATTIKSTLCKYDTVFGKSKQLIYTTCPDDVYLQSRSVENQNVQKLIAALNKKQAFVAWFNDHGGVSPNDDSYSIAKSKYRGMQHSLYWGGIRSKFLFNKGLLPNIAATSFDVRDLKDSFAALLNLPIQGTGKNIFIVNSVRRNALEFATFKSPNINDCVHSSPMYAVLHETTQDCVIVYYDAKRTEAYFCNSTYQYGSFEYILAKPQSVTAQQFIPGCEIAVGHKITRTNVISSETKRKPHILIMLADDLGYGDVGWTNTNNRRQSILNTPNLDKLAQQSVILTDFKAHPACTASRAALLTSRYPFFTGIHSFLEGNYAPSAGSVPYLGYQLTNFSMLHPIMQKLGYKTFWYGKHNLGYQVSTNGVFIPAPCSNYYGVDYGRYYLAKVISPCSYYNQANPYFTEIADPTAVTDWISAITPVLNQNISTFSYLPFKNPHAPNNMHESFLASLNYSSSKNPRKFINQVTLNDKRVPLQVYYAAVYQMDQQVKRVIDFISNYDLNNWLILFTSDFGPENRNVDRNSVGSASPYARDHKRSAYTSVVPTFIFIGKNLYGKVIHGQSDKSMGLVDVLPTLYTAAGGDVNALPDISQHDGLNMLPCLLADNCAAQDNRYYLQNTRTSILGSSCDGDVPTLGVFHTFADGKFSLHLESAQELVPAACRFSRHELYNLSADPQQARNLINDPAMRDKIESMQAALFTNTRFNTPLYSNLWPQAGVVAHTRTWQSPQMIVNQPCYPPNKFRG